MNEKYKLNKTIEILVVRRTIVGIEFISDWQGVSDIVSTGMVSKDLVMPTLVQDSIKNSLSIDHHFSDPVFDLTFDINVYSDKVLSFYSPRHYSILQNKTFKYYVPLLLHRFWTSQFNHNFETIERKTNAKK